jgi:DNA-binding NtrC family response regulator/tetratricopeptide (TPR) repeat protein
MESSIEVQEALDLIRHGRFSKAVSSLKRLSSMLASGNRSVPTVEALLADALQRVGENATAEGIATRHLQRLPIVSPFRARFLFVKGNILRERGELAKAIEYLQNAVTLGAGDHELSCWAQLRLIAAISELRGWPAASLRMEEVKHTLTRLGDPRPFAALHLWLVETEAMRGDLDSAQRHLKVADSLLGQVDDVWLHGYLAINSAAVHYYLADIVSARTLAERAIAFAGESGHRLTLYAAHANLGYFEFALGHLAKAEESFQIARQCCERGSANEIVILDHIAETQLARGDLARCKLTLSTLATLGELNDDAQRRHYNVWALQTKIRLLLREGRSSEARQLSERLRPLIEELPRARTTTESHLLAAEALLPDDPSTAADALTPVLLSTPQLTPDLFAETERIGGRTLQASGAFHLAHVRLERAVHIFGVVRHSIGLERSRSDLQFVGKLTTNASIDAAERSLDRFRALFEMRTHAELFGQEAQSFLEELRCAKSITLDTDASMQRTTTNVSQTGGDSLHASERVSMDLSGNSAMTVILSFVPLPDAKSKLTALNFQRVIHQILANGIVDSFNLNDVVWTTNEAVSTREGVAFASEAMLSVLRMVKRIAPLDVSVLVTGETGVGKEVVARAIHDHSRRAAMPLLTLNCAAVPKELLESQLFGHRKGSFSGASDNHQGIVRAANGGTLFLDEIAEIPIDMQAKLLRFLEMSEVHPIGESHPVKVNVRLIFATNGNLEEAVSQNRFRQDLFYRLNVIPIKVPPLRERREEIPVLANLFAQRFAREFGKEPVQFSGEAMEHLIIYNWPGNVRQLANEIRRIAALMESGARTTTNDLSNHIQLASAKGIRVQECTPHITVRIDQPLDQATTLLESEMIKHALKITGGLVTPAASSLGISRKGLYLKRVRLGLLNSRITQH